MSVKWKDFRKAKGTASSWSTGLGLWKNVASVVNPSPPSGEGSAQKLGPTPTDAGEAAEGPSAEGEGGSSEQAGEAATTAQGVRRPYVNNTVVSVDVGRIPHRV